MKGNFLIFVFELLNKNYYCSSDLFDDDASSIPIFILNINALFVEVIAVNESSFYGGTAKISESSTTNIN